MGPQSPMPFDPDARGLRVWIKCAVLLLEPDDVEIAQDQITEERQTVESAGSIQQTVGVDLIVDEVDVVVAAAEHAEEFINDIAANVCEIVFASRIEAHEFN